MYSTVQLYTLLRETFHFKSSFHHSTVDKIDMFPSLTAVVVSLIAFLTLLDTLSAQTTSRLGKFSVSGTILIPIDIYDYSFPTMMMRFNC